MFGIYMFMMSFFYIVDFKLGDNLIFSFFFKLLNFGLVMIFELIGNNVEERIVLLFIEDFCVCFLYRDSVDEDVEFKVVFLFGLSGVE